MCTETVINDTSMISSGVVYILNLQRCLTVCSVCVDISSTTALARINSDSAVSACIREVMS